MLAYVQQLTERERESTREGGEKKREERERKREGGEGGERGEGREGREGREVRGREIERVGEREREGEGGR